MGRMSDEAKEKSAVTRKKNQKAKVKAEQELFTLKADLKAEKAKFSSYKRGFEKALEYMEKRS